MNVYPICHTPHGGVLPRVLHFQIELDGTSWNSVVLVESVNFPDEDLERRIVLAVVDALKEDQ